ncbi:hypothetical protein BJ322DRAFT_1167858 [Thelephora terrestris]|uniref:CID domain-containing protein n=1 Tax=Thelephora terrestris TaxID=56493 RepID=A0A9P6H6J8_9AGAM|nr:hypothetical protein BJ322DRAFT_1167858 [Thelephora terrestris]
MLPACHSSTIVAVVCDVALLSSLGVSAHPKVYNGSTRQLLFLPAAFKCLARQYGTVLWASTCRLMNLLLNEKFFLSSSQNVVGRASSATKASALPNLYTDSTALQAYRILPPVRDFQEPTYSQVDESTKAKMIKILATWQAGAPNSKELFGAVPQVAIEQELFGTNALSDAGHISPTQALGELQFAVASSLTSASPIRENGLPQDEPRQMLSQLRNITRPPVQPPPLSYPVAPNMSALLPSTTYSQYSYNHAGPSSAPPQRAYPQDTLDVKPSFPSDPPVQPVSAIPSAPTNQAGVPALPAVSGIASLYSALVKAGILGAPGAPPVTSKIVNEPKSESTDSSSKNMSVHARKLLSQRIELSTA